MTKTAARPKKASSRARSKPAVASEVVRVIGAGFHFPERTANTFELIKQERPGLLIGNQIRQSIGCLQIHIAGPQDTPTTLAASASHQALESAGVAPADLDLVVTIACTPPDFDLWSMPAKLAAGLGATRAECFGMGDAGCAGAFAAFRGVLPMMQAPGGPQRVLIASGNITPGHHFFPPATIFGDGAGALVLERTTDAQAHSRSKKEASPRPTVVRADFYSFTHLVDAFGTQAGLGLLRSEGRLEPSWYAVSIRDPDVYSLLRTSNFDLGAQAIRTTLDRAGWSVSDIHWLIPDNVSAKVGHELAHRLGLPFEHVLVENCTRYGHAFTSDAFVNLATVFEHHPLRAGDRVVCTGMGLGQHWGVMLLEVPR